MRIIAGVYGGRLIDTPNKNSIHPMGDRIRSAIFNKLHTDINDKDILDAFAGSGAVGIEALSRGAKSATFVEQDRDAVKIIRKNLDSLNISDNIQIIPTTVLNWLKHTENQQFDYIFADPPYHNIQNNSVIALKELLKLGGYLILSNPKNAPELKIDGLELIDTRIYADAKILFYKK